MKYITYANTTGVITSFGDMPEDGLTELELLGYNVIRTGDKMYPMSKYKVDVSTMEIVPILERPSRVPALKSAIKTDLVRTDYTQAVDAPEHITEEVQTAWRDYRRLLREAMNETDFFEILNRLPKYDPDGNDMYSRFRTSIIPTTSPYFANGEGSVVTTQVPVTPSSLPPDPDEMAVSNTANSS